MRGARETVLDGLLLWLFAAAFRLPSALHAATDPVHPDAVHQSLEVAHLWAYGAGPHTHMHDGSVLSPRDVTATRGCDRPPAPRVCPSDAGRECVGSRLLPRDA